MECPSCQHENPADSSFCLKCGGKLERFCPSCAKLLPPDAAFCNSCGHDLSQPKSPSDTPTKPAEPSAPTGERRQATVMFSDLSGYTAMNEKLDPEEVEGIMSRIKAEAVKIVENHGGIVSQFVGDEVLALFGIPTAHEDDPRRAVKAALELHNLAHIMSPEVEEKIGRPLRMHTGINSGLIVTSNRDDRDGRVGITGDTVNTGARLKALAEDDQVLISPETRRHIAPFFDLEPQPSIEMKGKGDSMAPYRVLGETRVKTRFEAAELRGFTPFVGRKRELATLNECLENALAGEGQFVTVAGEAGVGKSRLLYEFRHSLDQERVNVLQGRCQAHGTHTPYLPLIDALRRGLQLSETDAPDTLAKKAAANAKAIDPALEPYIPAYLHLLSITSMEYPLPESLKGDELRRTLQEAYAAITTQSAAQKPLVFFLEDWHWADEASDAALKYLIGLLAPHPLLLVAIYRPEYAANWGNLGHHTPISLGPLDPVNGGRIVRAMLQVPGLPDGIGDLIHERTGGNPFFIEEVCNDLKEQGVVKVRDGKASIVTSPEQISLPDTVQAVIRSRLDRLDNDHREILRLASVIGREFSLRLLEHAYSEKKLLVPLLEALKGQQLIQQVRVLPEVAYLFKHVLTQVVVYDTLLIERRKALHGLVGRAIEELYADRLEENYEQLAYHFQNSDDVEKAIRYLELAGDNAARSFSLREARQRYWAAIEILDGQKMSADQMRYRIDLNLKWAGVSYYVPSEQQIRVLETSLQLSESLVDKTRMAKVTLWIGRMFYILGQPFKALPMFRRCADIAEELRDQELLALAYTASGRASVLTAAYNDGIQSLEKGIPILKRLNNFEEAGYSITVLAFSYVSTGQFHHGLTLHREALAIAERIKNLSRQAQAHFLLGHSLIWSGDLKSALAHFDRSIEIAQRTEDALTFAIATGFRGYAAFLAGEQAEGIALMNEAVKNLEATGFHLLLMTMRAFLAEGYALAGSAKNAKSSAEGALREREYGKGVGETIAVRALAMAAALENPPDWKKFYARMADSLRLAEEREECPQLAVTRFRYAGLLQQKGDLPEAREQLDKATALFREMEMTWWLEQAEKLGKILA